MKAKLKSNQHLLDSLSKAGVCLDINKRWEEGWDHHPRSRILVEAIRDLDYEIGGNTLDIEIGGDGDNGEDMMYLLDIIFEYEDKTGKKL